MDSNSADNGNIGTTERAPCNASKEESPLDQTADQSASDAATSANQKRPLDDDDDDDPTKNNANKRARHHLGGDCVAKELLCPITRELPIDPVTAEDGCTYERAAIKQHFRENPVRSASDQQGGRLGIRTPGGAIGSYWRSVLDYILGSFSFRLGGFTVGVGGERLQQHDTSTATEGGEKSAQNLPDVRSPMTNAIMGQTLLPAIHVKNTIRHLIESDVIQGEHADAWRKGIQTKDMLEDYVKRAAEGDVSVMWEVGQWHFHGKHGFDVDKEAGFQLFKKAADAYDPKGMASAGSCLVEGWGTEANICEGFLLSGIAAGLGSDLASWNLACWYHYGHITIKVDKEKALHWYSKVVDGSCSERHLNEYLCSLAKTRFEKLKAMRSEA